jgi:hypothetical protein
LGDLHSTCNILRERRNSAAESGEFIYDAYWISSASILVLNFCYFWLVLIGLAPVGATSHLPLLVRIFGSSSAFCLSTSVWFMPSYAQQRFYILRTLGATNASAARRGAGL